MNNLIERLKKIQSELEVLNHAHIYVGVAPSNDHLTMIALVQEYGKHIAAKNYPYLVIPTSGAGGLKASQIDGLYKRGMTLGVNDPNALNGYRVCFVLKRSVDIPSRPFLRYTFNHNSDKWIGMMRMNAKRVVNGELKAKDALQVVADTMQNDIKQTIKDMKIPNNAPLTIERKGRDDPLVDKGNLYNSIETIITYN